MYGLEISYDYRGVINLHVVCVNPAHVVILMVKV
jgi:hypothetical protein